MSRRKEEDCVVFMNDEGVWKAQYEGYEVKIGGGERVFSLSLYHFVDSYIVPCDDIGGFECTFYDICKDSMKCPGKMLLKNSMFDGMCSFTLLGSDDVREDIIRMRKELLGAMRMECDFELNRNFKGCPDDVISYFDRQWKIKGHII